MEALNEALLEPANNGAREDGGAAPVLADGALARRRHTRMKFIQTRTRACRHHAATTRL